MCFVFSEQVLCLGVSVLVFASVYVAREVCFLHLAPPSIVTHDITSFIVLFNE
jgi:hypothetical protein